MVAASVVVMEPEQTPTPDGDPPDVVDLLAGIQIPSRRTGGLPPSAAVRPLPSDAGGGSEAGPVADAVAGLTLIAQGAALVQAAPTSVLSSAELRDALAAAVGVRAQVDAGYLHLLAALDDRPDAVPGAATGRNGVTFLIHAGNLAPARAGKDVRAAHALDLDGAGITPTQAGSADPAGQGLPRMGAALAAGEVSVEHVDVAVGCLGRIPGQVLTEIDPHGVSCAARVDAFLTEHAKLVSPPTLRQIAAQLVAVLTPDAEDTYDPKAYERRYVSWGQDAAGMLIGSFALDPVAGARFRTALEAIMKTQRVDPYAHTTPDGDSEAADSKAADSDATGEKEAGVQETLPLRDERSLGQRRADALDQLCRDFLHGSSPTASGTQVLIVATPGQLADALAAQPAPLDADGAQMQPPSARPGQGEAGVSFYRDEPVHPHDLVYRPGPVGEPGEVSGQPLPGVDPNPRRPERGQPVAAGLAIELGAGPVEAATLALFLCNAVLTGITLDESGAILNYGRSRRFASPAQLRALIARDRGCIAPGCGMPPARCEAHHVIWWRHGGGTDIDLLALLCARHHAAVHAGIWTIQMIDGVPWMTPPAWVDRTRTPRRNLVPLAEHDARALGQHLRNTQLRLDLPGLDLPGLDRAEANPDGRVARGTASYRPARW